MQLYEDNRTVGKGINTLDQHTEETHASSILHTHTHTHTQKAANLSEEKEVFAEYRLSRLRAKTAELKEKKMNSSAANAYPSHQSALSEHTQ